MRVTLVVPQLAAAPADALVPLRRLAARAGTARVLAHDLDAAVIAAAGLPEHTAIAPLAARGAGFDSGTSYVLRADPVALVAGRDDILLSGRIDDLTLADAQALAATLNGHFAQDGLAFHAVRGDTWFVTARDHVPIETTPLSAVRGALHPHLPRGEHAPAWRRWWSELQMLLHAHPVNEAREAAGRLPVTAVWLSGGGVASPVSTATTVYAAPGAHGDVARGIGDAQPAPAAFARLPKATATLVVLAPADPATFARDWLEPALDDRALAELVVLTDRDGRTLQWRAARPSYAQRLRARFAGTPPLLPPA